MKYQILNKDLQEIYLYKKSKKYSYDIIKAFFRKIDVISNAKNEQELRAIKGNHFEKLVDKNEIYSMRLNKQYRLEFTFIKKNEIKILLIQNISKHYE